MAMIAVTVTTKVTHPSGIVEVVSMSVPLRGWVRFWTLFEEVGPFGGQPVHDAWEHFPE